MLVMRVLGLGRRLSGQRCGLVEQIPPLRCGMTISCGMTTKGAGGAGGGLHVREGGGLGFGRVAELVEEDAGEAGAGVVGVGGEGDFGTGSEGAEVGVGDDLLDELSGGVGGLDGGGARQVQGGDLEAIEQKSGAAGIELVGGEPVEDLADGGLDGGAVFETGDGEVEGGGLVLALGEVARGDGLAAAGGVVVEAEVLAAEAGAAAAVAVGEDVAALEAASATAAGGFRGGGAAVGVAAVGVIHGVYPSPGTLSVKSS